MPVLGFNTQPSNSIVSARNGLTKVGAFVELGGTLIHDTTIDTDSFDFSVTGSGNILLEKDESIYSNYLSIGTFPPFSGEGIVSVRESATKNAFVGSIDGTLFGKDVVSAIFGYEDSSDIQTYIFADDTGLDLSATDNNPANATNRLTISPTGVGMWDAIDNTTAGIHSNINIESAQLNLRHANSFTDTRCRVDLNNNEVWSSFENAGGTIVAQTKLDLDGLRVIGIDQTAGVAAFRVQDGSLGQLVRVDNDGQVTIDGLGGSGSGYVAVDNNGVLSWGAGGSGWNLTGNTGLTDGVDNFIGTTDNIPIRFLVNGVNAGRIEDDFLYFQQTYFGYLSGNSSTAGASNIGIGYKSLFSNISDGGNTAIGGEALVNFNGTDGSSGNTALGSSTGANTIIGTYNTFIGSSARTQGGDYNNVISLGYDAAALSSNEFAIGTQDHLNFELNGATVGYVLTCDAANSQIWKLPSATSNTDTPTLSNAVNITASAVNVDTTFIQVVDAVTGETIVTAQYSLLINATTTLTLTTIDVTLPVTANPSADLAGQGAYNNNNAPVAASVAAVDGTHARVTFVPVATGSNYILSFSVSYRAN